MKTDTPPPSDAIARDFPWLIAEWKRQAAACRADAERLGKSNACYMELMRDAGQYEQSIYQVEAIRAREIAAQPLSDQADAARKMAAGLEQLPTHYLTSSGTKVVDKTGERVLDRAWDSYISQGAGVVTVKQMREIVRASLEEAGSGLLAAQPGGAKHERCDYCPSGEFRVYNGATGTLVCAHCGQTKQLPTPPHVADALDGDDWYQEASRQATLRQAADAKLAAVISVADRWSRVVGNINMEEAADEIRAAIAARAEAGGGSCTKLSA